MRDKAPDWPFIGPVKGRFEVRIAFLHSLDPNRTLGVVRRRRFAPIDDRDAALRLEHSNGEPEFSHFRDGLEAFPQRSRARLTSHASRRG